VLTAELAFVHASVSQASPQESFRISGVLTELAGKVDEGEAFAGDFMTNFFQAREHGGTTSKRDKSVKEAFSPPSPSLSPKVTFSKAYSRRGEGECFVTPARFQSGLTRISSPLLAPNIAVPR
jgi:hypothetical protein